MIPTVERPVNRVWILGAGFSRSLGGPLLTDLLSDGEHTLMKARFPEVASESEPVVRAYHWGTGVVRRFPKLWSNAETFLEFLGAADEGTTTFRVLENHLYPYGISEFRRRARRAITASC